MSKVTKVFKSYEDLPLVMNVDDVQNVMGLSKTIVYELVNRESFPKIKVGKRILIPKDGFIRWLKSQSE